MNIDYHPIDPDAIEAAVTEEDRQRVEDLCDSIAWYRRQKERSGGWTSQIERCEEELEELTGTSDVEELEGVLESDQSDSKKSETERKIEECEARIEWYQDHDYGESILETEYNTLRKLKSGGEG
jgi:hypothetical protein